MTIKVRWQWKWDDSYLTGTRDGERKRRKEKRRKHQHQHTYSPERANPERAREKKKRTDDGPNTDPRRGGRTEAPDTTYKARAKPTSAREGPKPDLTREHTWDRGPMGTELKTNDASTLTCRFPWSGSMAKVSSQPYGRLTHSTLEFMHN